MLEFWEAGLQFLVYLAICELHLSPPALSEMGSRMIWKTKHYALCTMHYAVCTMKHSCARVWFGKLPQFRRDSNTLWTRRPLCVRERPTLPLLFPHLKRESLPNLNFLGQSERYFLQLSPSPLPTPTKPTSEQISFFRALPTPKR